MKKLFSVLIVLAVGISACTVSVCRPVVKRCHTECYSVCCDPVYGYCYDCDCHQVCVDDCAADQIDGGR